MATIGCLGDIVFTVSDQVTMTLSELTWSGSSRYAVHARHLTHALTEYTGMDPDKVNFDITLSADLEVDPMTEMSRLWAILRSGQSVPLTIGNHCYGKYRWNITDLRLRATSYYRDGSIHTATVSVSLQEYLER